MTSSHVSVGVVRGAGDLQRRRIFDFPSERESNAHLVLIDRNAARIYRIRIVVLTSGHPETASIQRQKSIVNHFMQASLPFSAGSKTWSDVAGMGLVDLTAL